MSAYTVGVISLHQRNISILLFSHYLENSIKYFLLKSKIPTLSHNRYISLHAIAQVSYFLFLRYLKVLPNCLRRVSFRISNLGFPTRDSFGQIFNQIPCVNSFLIFRPTLNFELKIRNHHFHSDMQQQHFPILVHIQSYPIIIYLPYRI